jgi:hypothetical protein
MQTDEQMITARIRQVVGEVHAVDLDMVEDERDDNDAVGWAAQFGVSAVRLDDVASGNGHPVYRFSGTRSALAALVADYVD